MTAALEFAIYLSLSFVYTQKLDTGLLREEEEEGESASRVC